MPDVVKVFLAKTPLTTKSVTFVLAVVEVTVTTLLVDATLPVENPALNVPLYLPKLAATGLASVLAAAVDPEATLEKAAATSLGVMLTLAVKVRPLTVTKSFGFSALKVMRLDSVVPPAPSVLTTVGILSPVTILPTLPLLVEVAVTCVLLAAPVAKPSANVPLKLPLLKVAAVDAAAAANADMPDFKLENAVATSALVVEPVDVKVKPFKVNPCPAASAGKVMVLLSLLPKLLAAAPDTPVTPKGLDGGVVSKPKPKSEP